MSEAAARLLPRWPGWRHLPREARDTLFLLAVIGWTVLPHLPHLSWWCSVLTIGVLAWRARLAIANAPLPGRWTLAGVLAAIAAMTFLDFHTLIGKEPGVTLLVSLVALKTLELRARRDAFVVFFLGFFLILTQFFNSQSMLSAITTLVAIWGLLTALVLAHMPVGRPPLSRAGLLAARTALLGLPLMALLFVLFPRMGPLWGMPQDAISRTGLSERMTMGSMAELALDDSVALRLRFHGAARPPESLYFRGPVLSHFDGREWTPLRPDFRRTPLPIQLRVQGEAVSYDMTLEPSRVRTLPLLEAAPEAPRIGDNTARVSEDLEWRAIRPIYERVRVSARAYLDFDYGPTKGSASLATFLELPADYNPRTIQWARQMRQQQPSASPGQLAQMLMRRIATGGYEYTLTPGEYGRDAIDEFWLDRRQGFCEHFAAAFVVIMRAMGIPSRIVSGYQGAERNPVDGHYFVRQSAAHAWAEYWQEGRGWVRADPTAAVAPDRVQRGRNLVPEPGLVASAFGEMSPALWARLRNLWEATNNRWNEWVLGYGRTEQFGLLQRLGVSSPSWEDLLRLTAAAFAALAAGGALWAWLDRRRQDPWARQLARIRQALARIGVPARVGDTPRAMARLLTEIHGTRAREAADLLMALERQRYSRDAQHKPDATMASRFEREAKAIGKTLRSSSPVPRST